MLYRAVNVIEMKHSRAEIRDHNNITLVLTQASHDGAVIVRVMAGVGGGGSWRWSLP